MSNCIAVYEGSDKRLLRQDNTRCSRIIFSIMHIASDDFLAHFTWENKHVCVHAMSIEKGDMDVLLLGSIQSNKTVVYLPCQ